MSDDRGNIGRMAGRHRFEIVVSVAGMLALCLAIIFLVRYGDVYHFGESEYRRTGLSDQLAYLVPTLIFTSCVGLLALRRLCGGSITGQWKREQELLREARRQG